MASNANSDIVLSNFSVRRGITPTPARMFSRMPDGTLEPVIVKEASLLGTQSQFGVKPEDAQRPGNIQSVDTAFLHPDSDTLVIRFGVRFFRDSGSNVAGIEMCNLRDVEDRIRSLNDAYAAAGGFDHLGTLYAERITNGAWMWRNRYGYARTIRIGVKVDGVEDEALEFGKDNDPTAVAKLGAIIGKGLKGEAIVNLDVEGEVKIGLGQEVFPSQEMALNSNVSRVYYRDEQGHAMIHSQKIGNAIRTIDCWHPEYESIGLIAVEPYGSNVRRQEAYRYHTRGFYGYLKQVVDGKGPILAIQDAKTLKDLDAIQDAHYFMAVLIRGGVFGLKNDKGKEKAAA